MTRWDYIVAYSGTVEADSAEDAENEAWDAHYLLSDCTITVTERKDTDGD